MTYLITLFFTMSVNLNGVWQDVRYEQYGESRYSCHEGLKLLRANIGSKDGWRFVSAACYE